MKRSHTRRIYLVRHGTVEFPEGIRRCIGCTELPLSEKGRTQAERLAQYFTRHSVTKIFTSPLGRCRETAQILSGGRYDVEIEDGLREMDMGEWENLPLQELKEKRGEKLETEPEHGESRENALKRFRQTMDVILRRSEGDIVCVAHAGVNCCYLAELLGEPLETSRALPQPYGCLNLIETEQNGRKQVLKYGIMPEKIPDEEECREIWEHYHTPENVRKHCQAVCVQALRIGSALNQEGCELNLQMIRSAALLHDVARAKPEHTEEGARILRREGYPELAEMIRRHHDLTKGGCEWNANAEPCETEVVYLADKLTKETRTVTLEERFADSRRRCERQQDQEEALKKHERRYQEAKLVKNKIKKYLDLHRNAMQA